MCSCSLVQSSALIETMIDNGSQLSLQPQREEVKAEERMCTIQVRWQILKRIWFVYESVLHYPST